MGLSGQNKPMTSFWHTRQSQVNPFYPKIMSRNKMLAILSKDNIQLTYHQPVI